MKSEKIEKRLKSQIEFLQSMVRSFNDLKKGRFEVE